MSYRSFLFAFLLTAVVHPSRGQILPPRVGVVRYATGDVHPVLGVQGNYVIGKRLFDTVDALSFSEAGGLLSRRGSLLLVDQNMASVARFDEDSTKPVLNIGADLSSAIAWLPTRHTLVHWNGSVLVSVVVPDESIGGGEIVSVGKIEADTATMLSKSPDGVVEEHSISLRTGALLSRSIVPGNAGSVYRQENAIVSIGGGELVSMMTATGVRKTVPIRANDVWFERMSATCVHLHSPSSGRDWLLHFAGDQLALFELPAPPVETTSPANANSNGVTQ